MKKLIIIQLTIILMTLGLFIKVKAKTTYDNAAITWYDTGCNQRAWIQGSGNIYMGETMSIPSNSAALVDGTLTFFFNNTTCSSPTEFRQFDRDTSSLQIFMYVNFNTENSEIYLNQSSTGTVQAWGGQDMLGSVNLTLRGVDGLYSTCTMIASGYHTIQWNCPLTQSMQGKVNRLTVQYSIERPAYGSGGIYGNSITIGLQKSVMRVIETDYGSQIVEQQQQTNDYLNQTQDYNGTIDTTQPGANETIISGQMEDQLLTNYEFNGSVLDGLLIDTTASASIWNIVERLRGMNPAIITLMMTALGFGIIKLVLNR